MRVRWLGDPACRSRRCRTCSARRPGQTDGRSSWTTWTVLRSIDDDKMAVLTAQRAQVATTPRAGPGAWLAVATATDRPAVCRPAVARPPRPWRRQSRQERELAKLACYRGALPADLLTLVDAMRGGRRRVCQAVAGVSRRRRAHGGRHLAPATRPWSTTSSARSSTWHLAGFGADRPAARPGGAAGRPPIRAATRPRLPSPVYRRVVTRLVAVAAGGDA